MTLQIPASLLIEWLGVWSLLGLFLMWFDKRRAKSRSERVRERTFYFIAILGGFVGIFLGALLFRHKTRKASFWVPVGAALFLWIGVALVLATY